MPAAPDPDSLLDLAAVSVRGRGGEQLLTDITLTIPAGRITTILGRNGAGKTLLLKVCHGLLRPDGGRVLRGSSPVRQAMVFQNPALLRRSAAANIDFMLAACGVRPRALRRQRRDEVLELTALTPLAGRYARHLSTGEQHRLAIARAWAVRPDILFLDEPTANLDPLAGNAIESLITTISTSGCKIVMTTHDLNLARRVAGDVIFLDQGRLRAHSAASAFFDRPTDADIRRFLELQ